MVMCCKTRNKIVLCPQRSKHLICLACVNAVQGPMYVMLICPDGIFSARFKELAVPHSCQKHLSGNSHVVLM